MHVHKQNVFVVTMPTHITMFNKCQNHSPVIWRKQLAWHHTSLDRHWQRSSLWALCECTAATCCIFRNMQNEGWKDSGRWPCGGKRCTFCCGQRHSTPDLKEQHPKGECGMNRPAVLPPFQSVCPDCVCLWSKQPWTIAAIAIHSNKNNTYYSLLITNTKALRFGLLSLLLPIHWLTQTPKQKNRRQSQQLRFWNIFNDDQRCSLLFVHWSPNGVNHTWRTFLKFTFPIRFGVVRARKTTQVDVCPSRHLAEIMMGVAPLMVIQCGRLNPHPLLWKCAIHHVHIATAHFQDIPKYAWQFAGTTHFAQPGMMIDDQLLACSAHLLIQSTPSLWFQALK